jgi:hypothetical protein
MIEVAVLVLNRMRCPLTGIAARFTEDRRANFDIYLPLWLARYNKQILSRWRLSADHATAPGWRLSRLRARAEPPKDWRLARRGGTLGLHPLDAAA